jgi:hypothetical protein
VDAQEAADVDAQEAALQRSRRATEQRHELTARHSITSSARASRLGGTSSRAPWPLLALEDAIDILATQ